MLEGRSTLWTILRNTERLLEKAPGTAFFKMVDELRGKKVKISFFSSTPQGGTSILP